MDLSKFPKKQKRKLIILRHLVKKFDSNKSILKKVNTVIENVYPDFVTLRRYLIEYGF